MLHVVRDVEVHDAQAGQAGAEERYKFRGFGIGQVRVGGIAVGERFLEDGDDLGLGFGGLFNVLGDGFAFGGDAAELVLSVGDVGEELADGSHVFGRLVRP